MDFATVGEGEHPLYEPVKAGRDADFATIEEIAYKENGEIIVNKRRAMIPDLDELPLPAFDKIDMDFNL